MPNSSNPQLYFSLGGGRVPFPSNQTDASGAQVKYDLRENRASLLAHVPRPGDNGRHSYGRVLIQSGDDDGGGGHVPHPDAARTGGHLLPERAFYGELARPAREQGLFYSSANGNAINHTRLALEGKKSPVCPQGGPRSLLYVLER